MVLHHTDLGGAGKPPLIVLHGMLGSSRNWQTVGRDLANNFHVYALDARNHGKSPHAPEMTYTAMMDDVIAWMDANKVRKATVMGHSMGGKTAMLLACRHSDRVERLVVVDIAPKNYRWEAHRYEFLAMNELDLGSLQSRTEAEMKFEARVPDLGMRKFLATNLARDDARGWHWTINLPVITAALDEMEKSPLTPKDKFRGSTLFIAGGKSKYVEKSDKDAIWSHFADARIEYIPTAGHNPHMDHRVEFVQLAMGSVGYR